MLNTGRRQRGLSVVELMVGVTIGLFIVAAAAMVASGQLSSNRRLLLDAQLQQDLRAATEIIGRELRRAAALTDSLATNAIWRPDYGGTQVINTYASQVQPSSGTSTTSVNYRYVRSTNRITFGFDINDNKLRTLLDNRWQDLTDSTVMKVTSFTITNNRVAEIPLTCPNDCAGGGSACWPRIVVRDMDIEIGAESAADPSIKRSIRTTVRLRADLLERGDTSVTSGYCPA